MADTSKLNLAVVSEQNTSTKLPQAHRRQAPENCNMNKEVKKIDIK